MAINFAEVFLRESGAAQDRASNMVQLQLQANKFAADQAIAQANALANKANADSLAALRAFQIETGKEQQAQRRKLYENEEAISDLELEISKAEAKRVNQNLTTLQEQEEYLDSPIPEEVANQYGLPLTTTNKEFARYMQEELQRLNLEKQRSEVTALQEAVNEQIQQKGLREEFVGTFIDRFSNEEITMETAPGFIDPNEQFGFLTRTGKGLAAALLGPEIFVKDLFQRTFSDARIPDDDVALDPFSPANMASDDALRSLQKVNDLRRLRNKLIYEKETGVPFEAAQALVGRTGEEVSGIDPELLEQSAMIQIQNTPLETLFGASAAIQQSAGIGNPTNFLQQLMQQQARAQNPPPVEE